MKILFFYTTLVLFACCVKKNSNTGAKPMSDAKKYWKNFKEPFLDKIPDSFKVWLPVFDSMFMADQKFRSLEDVNLYSKHAAEQKYLDSINQHIVSGFLDKYGYPGNEQVGLKGMTAIKSVIQHSPIAMKEKYYHFIKNAFIAGKVDGPALAILEDRINCIRKRFQVYGTQVTQYKGKSMLFPVLNVDSLDSYRKSIGIKMPLNIYLTQFNIDWKPSEYKKLLPTLTKAYKILDSLPIRFVKE